LLRRPPQDFRDDGRRLALTESVSIIDVLVPYTKLALCDMIAKNTGDPLCNITDTGKTEFEDKIELAISAANTALRNSGISGVFRLAHAYLLESNIINETKSHDEILLNLRNSIQVQNKSNEYRADVVTALIQKDQPYCGKAYSGIPVPSLWAYGIVSYECATNNYSLAHELGHMLGMNHGREALECPNTGTCLGSDYRFAWRVAGRFRTIGAYPCNVTFTGDRVLYYSQPGINYTHSNGLQYPVGNVENDNARITRTTWNTVSKFFSACGNGICEPYRGENCITSSRGCIKGNYTDRGTCENGKCEDGEDCKTCPLDCPGRLDISRTDLRYCCVGGPIEKVESFLVAYAQSCTSTSCKWNSQCDTSKGVSGEICVGNMACEPGENVENAAGDCKCIDDGSCDDSFETDTCADCPPPLQESKCLSSGRNCAFIFPDPCCDGCKDRICL